jgi:hypothetical protein
MKNHSPVDIKELLWETQAIDAMINSLQDRIQQYITEQQNEAISYQSYFTKRFPLLRQMNKGITDGIKQLEKLEAEYEKTN